MILDFFFVVFNRALERSMSVSRSSGFCWERERARRAQFFSLLTLRFTVFKTFNFNKNFYHTAWKYQNNPRANFKIYDIIYHIMIFKKIQLDGA